MLSLLLALAATTAVQNNQAVNSAREAYSSCLRQYLEHSLEADMAVDAFESGIAGQCADRATAFEAAMVARDGAGGGRAAAEEDARMTMEDIRANMVDYYGGVYADAHPTPAAPATPPPAEPATPEPQTTPQTPQ